MIISIITLFVLLTIAFLYLTACIMHIRKIQKKLEAISNEQSTQHNDIRAIAIHTKNLTIAHNELVEAVNGTATLKNKSKIKKEKLNAITSYFGPIGEA